MRKGRCGGRWRGRPGTALTSCRSFLPVTEGVGFPQKASHLAGHGGHDASLHIPAGLHFEALMAGAVAPSMHAAALWRILQS